MPRTNKKFKIKKQYWVIFGTADKYPDVMIPSDIETNPIYQQTYMNTNGKLHTATISDASGMLIKLEKVTKGTLDNRRLIWVVKGTATEANPPSDYATNTKCTVFEKRGRKTVTVTEQFDNTVTYEEITRVLLRVRRYQKVHDIQPHKKNKQKPHPVETAKNTKKAKCEMLGHGFFSQSNDSVKEFTNDINFLPFESCLPGPVSLSQSPFALFNLQMPNTQPNFCGNANRPESDLADTDYNISW